MEYQMNKLIKSMMLVAGVTVVSITNAATPAETAGICAANAAVIKRAAEAAGYKNVLAIVTEQSARNFNNYGNQPGFETAFRWEFKQNRDLTDRMKAGDGCLKSGF